MTEKPIKNIFTEGPISPAKIASDIAAHQSKTNIGAHAIFLGQVRADATEHGTVQAIEYTAYTDMALATMHAIREDIFAKYNLTCMHVHHSLGRVNSGEICLFVFTSSAHRQAATQACNEVVERIKSSLPVWGKELFEDNTHQWKINTP